MSFLSPPESIFHSYEDHHLHHFTGLETRRSTSHMGWEGGEEMSCGADGEMSEDEGYSQLGERKRRLDLEQVKALEKSFELGNKLDPERKRQLARALGLQPRQVAIWFQNRRARWKTKQLERDYNVLKKQFNSIKADNDALKNQNMKLRTQLMALKGQEPFGVGAMANLNKETEGSWSNGSESEDTTAVFYTQISNNLATGPSITGGLSLIMPPYLLGQPLNPTAVARDEGFCNMLNVMEDQLPFWPWQEAEPPHHQL